MVEKNQNIKTIPLTYILRNTKKIEWSRFAFRSQFGLESEK